ncbi:MAG: response regulator transcription factor [Rhodothermales bacterium]
MGSGDPDAPIVCPELWVFLIIQADILSADTIQTMEIMLVDDDPSIRDLYSRALDSMADMCCTSVFGSYEELADAAGGSFSERLREPHVLLMDIGLPGKGGVDAIAAVRKELGWKRCSIVMLTIQSDPNVVRSAIANGANGYLHKDVEPVERIAARLEDIRHDGSPMTPDIASFVWSNLVERKPAKKEEQLNDRQVQVLRLVAQGLTNNQIADEIGVTVDTVSYHLRGIYAKLHIHSKAEAALWWGENRAIFDRAQEWENGRMGE